MPLPSRSGYPGRGAGRADRCHGGGGRAQLDDQRHRQHQRLAGNRQLGGAPRRGFTDDELRAGAAVCLIGETLRRELFGDGDAVGGQLRVRQMSCEIIGRAGLQGTGRFGNDQDEVVLLPLKTLQRRVTGSTRCRPLLVSMQDGSDPDRVKASLTQLLRRRRKLADADEDNFNVLDTKQLADTLSGTTKVMTMLLGAVAAVSLLVGGIGIMNIMLVSVTERTREIGLRLAIGALEREVLLQFLIEAVVLAALGGLLGIVLATGASVVLSQVMGCLTCSTRGEPAVLCVLGRYRRVVWLLSGTAGGAHGSDRRLAPRMILGKSGPGGNRGKRRNRSKLIALVFATTVSYKP